MNRQLGQAGQNAVPQQGASVEEMRSQIVAIMQQTGVPIPPKPNTDDFRSHGADAVHELMHIRQAENMANVITELSQELIAARDVLAEVGEHAETVENIDNTLNIVSAQSLASSKLVLDLQEIEQELRDEEAEDFERGGYL